MDPTQGLAHCQELVKVPRGSIGVLANVVSALGDVLPDLQFVVVGIVVVVGRALSVAEGSSMRLGIFLNDVLDVIV